MPDERTDLYAVLGLDPSATQRQISHAYRAMLRRHHPDTRGTREHADGAASDTALQQVLAAYAILGDPVRRAEYDRRRTPPRLRPIRTYQPPIRVGPVRWHADRHAR